MIRQTQPTSPVLALKTTVGIAGKGNVASHLFKAFAVGASDTIETLQLDSHNLADMTVRPDIILLAVSDNAISEVSASIPDDYKGTVAHVSGATPLSAITPGNYRRGVIYPLQTFSKDVELDYSEIPFFIEGETPETTDMLRQLAEQISTQVAHADSRIRSRIHLASVIACNFSNHLYAIADEILSEEGLDITALGPLLKETLRKGMLVSPAMCQTGPAARRDTATISRHMEMLSDRPDTAAIYRLMTHSIMTGMSQPQYPIKDNTTPNI